jgi:hypothetical protein
VGTSVGGLVLETDRRGASMISSVGDSVGSPVGASVGVYVGSSVGANLMRV